MLPSEIRGAVVATRAIVSSLGLAVDDVVLLNNSNKITLRLLPCNVLARVSRGAPRTARLEIDLAQRLAECGSPVAHLAPWVEPLVYERGGFVITFWTYYEASDGESAPADYAGALERLHAGMRQLDVTVPSFEGESIKHYDFSPTPTEPPAIGARDRETLSNTLRNLGPLISRRSVAEQLVHGEPHPGNVLATDKGLLFIDFETCCRAPVEFDLAHLPAEVAEHYPGVDRSLLLKCRMLVLAMITTWRWDRDDQLPNGRQLGETWLAELRAMQDGYDETGA